MVLEVAGQALGQAVWRQLVNGSPLMRVLRTSTIVPVLSRLRIEGEAGPFAVAGPVSATGSYGLAHADDGRIFLLMWGELAAPHAHTYGPSAAPDAARATAMRVFAEHVMTRPFGPAEERRVRELPEPMEPVPAVAWNGPAPEALASLPPGARPLDEVPLLDDAELPFGLIHTDSNQHVNSLVYLRAFEEALLRRLRAHGRSTSVLSRMVDVVYRKPFFAGQVARVRLQAFELDGRVGAAGTFVLDGAADARPHAFVHMLAG